MRITHHMKFNKYNNNNKKLVMLHHKIIKINRVQFHTHTQTNTLFNESHDIFLGGFANEKRKKKRKKNGVYG